MKAFESKCLNSLWTGTILCAQTKNSHEYRGRMAITNLNCKETDTHQYLHYKSCHLGHCKWSIPFSQTLRMKPICWRPVQYHGMVRDLKGFLIYWGHKEDVMEIKSTKPPTFSGTIYVLGWQSGPSLEQIQLVVTYYRRSPWLNGILQGLFPFWMFLRI